VADHAALVQADQGDRIVLARPVGQGLSRPATTPTSKFSSRNDGSAKLRVMKPGILLMSAR
jgi:hypothetical protein